MAIGAALSTDASVRLAAVIAARVAAPAATFYARLRGRATLRKTFTVRARPVTTPLIGAPRETTLTTGPSRTPLTEGGLLKALARGAPRHGGLGAGARPRKGPVRAVAMVAGAVARLDTAIPARVTVGARPTKAAQVGRRLPPQARPLILGLRPLLHVGVPVAPARLTPHEGVDGARGRGVPVAAARARLGSRTATGVT